MENYLPLHRFDADKPTVFLVRSVSGVRVTPDFAFYIYKS